MIAWTSKISRSIVGSALASDKPPIWTQASRVEAPTMRDAVARACQRARGLNRDLIANLGTLDCVVAKDNVDFLGHQVAWPMF